MSFCDDLETTSTTESQINRYRAEMYLNRKIMIELLGVRINGSGIDDRIWFKFKTKAIIKNILIGRLLICRRSQKQIPGIYLEKVAVPQAGLILAEV